MRTLDRPWLNRRPPDLAGVYLSNSAVALAVHDPGAAGVESLRCQASISEGLGQLTSLLEEQKVNMGLGITHCTMVLSPDYYTLSLIERPDVNAAEVKDAVRWKIQEYIDFPADEAVIDVFPLPQGASRSRTELVFVVAIQKSRLRAMVEGVTAAGMTPICVDIAELALRTLAQSLFPDPAEAVAVLRITANSGMINITRGNELFLSRRITGVPATFDAASWDTFKDMLLLQVQRSIDYYESALSQGSAQVLMVAATHEWQQRIVDYLSEMLPLGVRSMAESLCSHYAIELFNPQPSRLSPTALGLAEEQALAAVIPALGGALRNTRMAAGVGA